MGVRAGATIYDSVTGTKFGPLFQTVEQADAFIDWYNEREDAEDLRQVDDAEIDRLATAWFEETGRNI